MSHRTYQLFFLYSADRFLQYKQSICCYYYFEKFIIVSRERKMGLLFGLNLQTKWNEKWMVSVTLRRLLWGVSESRINMSTPFSYKKASRQWAAHLQTGALKYFFQNS